MAETRKAIGNGSERAFCALAKAKGWWFHGFAYKFAGQPCDAVALKGDRSLLVDVKHCESPRFALSRIEPNQMTCFEYAASCGVEGCGFAVWFSLPKKWRWLPWAKAKELLAQGESSVLWGELGELPL